MDYIPVRGSCKPVQDTEEVSKYDELADDKAYLNEMKGNIMNTIGVIVVSIMIIFFVYIIYNNKAIEYIDDFKVTSVKTVEKLGVLPSSHYFITFTSLTDGRRIILDENPMTNGLPLAYDLGNTLEIGELVKIKYFKYRNGDIKVKDILRNTYMEGSSENVSDNS